MKHGHLLLFQLLHLWQVMLTCSRSCFRPISDTCLGSLPWTLTLFQVPAAYQDSWQTRAPLRKDWGKKPNLEGWFFPSIIWFSDIVLPCKLWLYFSSLHPIMFKPDKFIRNDELEVHLHTQPCNLMLPTQRVAHPYDKLGSINRYCCSWPCHPPPPATHTTFHFS